MEDFFARASRATGAASSVDTLAKNNPQENVAAVDPLDDFFARAGGKPSPTSPLGKSEKKGSVRDEGGFFEYLDNLTMGFAVGLVAEATMGEDETQDRPISGSFGERVAQARAGIRLTRATQNNGAELAMSDLVRIFNRPAKAVLSVFDPNADPKAQVAAAASWLGETARGAKDAAVNDPTGFIGSMAKEFIKPIGDYVEAMTGSEITDDFSPLTPEEKAARIKSAASFGVMIAVGAGTAKAMLGSQAATRSAVGIEAATGKQILSTPALIQAGKSVSKKGALGRTLMENTTIAATSGTAQGAVMFANEDEQLAEMFINGVMFAPLGIAFEALSIGKGTKAKLKGAELARDVLHLRQMQAGMNSRMPDIAADVINAMSADDITDVLLASMKGAQAGTDGGMHKARIIVQGVSADKANKARDDFGGYVADFVRADGQRDLLFIDPATPMLERLALTEMFYETGAIPNQIVDYQGKPHVVIGVATKAFDPNNIGAKGVRLQELHGERVVIARQGEFQHLPNLEMAKLSIEQSNVTLKSQFIREVAAGIDVSETTAQKVANQAHRDARTGVPLVGIFFRQQKSYAGVPGAGRFYDRDAHTVRDYASLRGMRGRGNVAGPAHSLMVHRIAFNNPFVVQTTMRGGQYSFLPTFKKWLEANNRVTRKAARTDTKLNEMLARKAEMEKVHSDNMSAKQLEEYEELVLKLDDYMDTRGISYVSLQQSNLEVVNYGEFDADIRLLQSAYDTRKKAGGEAGYQHLDKLIAKISKKAGFDGIIYPNGEVVDLTGNAVAPWNQKAEMPTVQPTITGSGKGAAVIDIMYSSFKDKLAHPETAAQKARVYLHDVRDRMYAAGDVRSAAFDKMMATQADTPAYEAATAAYLEAEKVHRDLNAEYLELRAVIDDVIANNPDDARRQRDESVQDIAYHTNKAEELKKELGQSSDPKANEIRQQYYETQLAEAEYHKRRVATLDALLERPEEFGRIPEDWRDRIPEPDNSFDTVFRQYAESVGMTPEEFPALRSEFLKRFTKELQGLEGKYTGKDRVARLTELDSKLAEIRGRYSDSSMDDLVEIPEYKVLYDEKLSLIYDTLTAEDWISNVVGETKRVLQPAAEALQKLVDADIAALRDVRLMDSARLSNIAQRSGYVIEDAGSGNIGIRDVETGVLLHRTNDIKDATDFIKNSGRPDAVDLDGDATIPPSFTGGIATSPLGGMGPESFPYHQGKMGNLFDAVNMNTSWATPFRALFVSMDNLHGTEMFVKVFDRLQDAKRKTMAEMRDMYQRTDPIEKIMVKFTKREREMIGEYIESMSPDEVIDKLMTRKMTDFEVQTAKRLADGNIDIPRVLQFRRQRSKLYDMFEGDELLAQVAQLRKEMAIDDDHLAAARMYEQLEGMSRKDASIGAINRLARAYQNKERTRSQFAADNKMGGDMIHAANQIDALYRELAPIFGIAPEQRLSHYMTHARIYTDGNVHEAMRHFSGDVTAKDFYARMARTGEITAFEKDPVRAIQRYIKAGYEAIHFNDAWAEARNNLNDEIAKMPLAAQGQARAIADRYMSDLRGHPGAADVGAQVAIDKMNENLGLGLSVSVKKDLVNAVITTVPAATQGMRLMTGLRDLGAGITFFGGRFGFGRMARMLELGTKAMTSDVRKALEASGDINISSPLTLVDPIDENNAVLGGKFQRTKRRFDKVTRTMYRLSGQQDVYALLHAGSYLETRETVSAELLKLSRGETKWNNVRKKIQLDTYDAPVVREFQKLVEQREYEKATRFLAIQSGYETIGVFGLANHPYLWGTNTGRIAGQFGNWSMWARTNIVRMASRGSWAQRAGALTRFAALNAGIMAAGEWAGLEMGSWNVWSGMAFRGGPLVGAAGSMIDAASPYPFIQRRGQQEVARLFPSFDPQTGELNPRSIFVPGSFFAHDIMEAVRDVNVTGGSPQTGLRALGFRPANPQ